MNYTKEGNKIAIAPDLQSHHEIHRKQKMKHLNPTI